MLAVNYSTIRSKLKDYCDKATDENETVIVTRKDEKNVWKCPKRKYCMRTFHGFVWYFCQVYGSGYSGENRWGEDYWFAKEGDGIICKKMSLVGL